MVESSLPITLMIFCRHYCQEFHTGCFASVLLAIFSLHITGRLYLKMSDPIFLFLSSKASHCLWLTLRFLRVINKAFFNLIGVCFPRLFLYPVLEHLPLAHITSLLSYHIRLFQAACLYSVTSGWNAFCHQPCSSVIRHHSVQIPFLS
jgi:hypothetical protein